MNRTHLGILMAAIVCLAFIVAQGQIPRGSAARQAWEYKSLVFTIDGVGRESFFEDGSKVAGGLVPIARIPELGNQGWELISVAATDRTTGTGASVLTYTYWLKRPK